MNVAKERTNLYLNSELKKMTQEKLNSYGMNLSSFVNLMMAKLVRKDVDILLPDETIEVLEDFENSKKNFERPVELDDIVREFNKLK